MIQLANLQSLTTSAFRNVAYFGRIILVVASLSVGFAVLSSVHTRPASAAGGPGVTVLNTPLPIQGSVSVNNFPTTQTVTGTVNIGNLPSGNSVQVTNTAATPVPVRDVENSAQFYFQGSCELDWTTNTGQYCSVLNVPSTATAVIETISYVVRSDQPSSASIPLAQMVTTTAGTPSGWELVPTFMQKLGGTNPYYLYHVTTPVKIYADPGSSVYLSLEDVFGTAYIIQLTITGHYVCTNNLPTC